MTGKAPTQYRTVEDCVENVIERVGKKIVLGLPLGLGKPNQFVNEMYRRAKEDPEINLTISTALSLEKPSWSNDLERRFMEPFVERVFGGYIDLDYMLDLRRGKVPSNVTIREFYTKAGSTIGLRHAQQNYISSNYTHVSRDVADSGVNVVAQMVCKDTIDGRTLFSLSCNPDVSLDIIKLMREQERVGAKIAIIAQVNQNLPFMFGDAVVEPQTFTGIIENPLYDYRLFGTPKMSITTQDYMIGLHTSALIKDGGTLQIGIGSLGDALCYALQLRHEQNDAYKKVLADLNLSGKFEAVIDGVGGTDPFDEGVVGSTEMLIDGYLHLMKSGIVKRKTYNNTHIQRLVNEGKIREDLTPETLDTLLEEKAIHSDLTEEDFRLLREFGIVKEECAFEDGFISIGEVRVPADLADPGNMDAIRTHCLGEKLKNGILVHGGFFLGPESFYEELRNMSVEERRQIHMTSVLNVNQLYENEYGSEELKRLQRKHARFVNACLMVTLSGAVVSDGLENFQTVSGVGGQYNFVSQAHALPDGRSILMCKSTRAKGKEVHSNIVFKYGHITVPRHLRDIVITEYGIADLRGKSDHEIIAALLNVTDSRFQEALLREAKEAKKISDDYRIPDRFRDNLPGRLESGLSTFKKEGFFPPFPFGTDFTAEELVIGKALRLLKEKMAQGLSKVSSLGRAMTIGTVPEKARPYLERLQLGAPHTPQEKMMQKLVVHALSLTGSI